MSHETTGKTLFDKILKGIDTQFDWEYNVPCGWQLYGNIYDDIRHHNHVSIKFFEWVDELIDDYNDEKINAVLKALQPEEQERTAARQEEEPVSVHMKSRQRGNSWAQRMKTVQQEKNLLYGALLKSMGASEEFIARSTLPSWAGWNDSHEEESAVSWSNSSGCGGHACADCHEDGIAREEPTQQTCADCANQDESQTPVGSIGVTCCLVKGNHVPLMGKPCGEFSPIGESCQILASKESANATMSPQAQLIEALRVENANLKSQKESLKSSVDELQDLVRNCPECDVHSEVIAVLKTRAETLTKELLAERSWRVGAKCQLDHRADKITKLNEVIKNLQAELQGLAKENYILGKSLRTAEYALGLYEHIDRKASSGCKTQ